MRCVEITKLLKNTVTLEALQVPISRHAQEKVVVVIQNRMMLSHKENGVLLFVTAWMDLEGIMLSQNNSDRDKCHISSLICGI